MSTKIAEGQAHLHTVVSIEEKRALERFAAEATIARGERVTVSDIVREMIQERMTRAKKR